MPNIMITILIGLNGESKRYTNWRSKLKADHATVPLPSRPTSGDRTCTQLEMMVPNGTFKGARALSKKRHL